MKLSLDTDATALTLQPETLPAVPFQWRDRHAARHQITDMETRHLFFTVRMIWNHRMPPVARSISYKRYTFGPEYTPAYLAQAIRKMIPELLSREDMQADWMAEINRWLVYLGHADHNLKEISWPLINDQPPKQITAP